MSGTGRGGAAGGPTAGSRTAPGRAARARRGLEAALEGATLALIAALAIVVILGVGFRKAGHALVWYDEVASILLAWVTYYGAALAALRRAHIGFPTVLQRMGPRLRIPLMLVGEVFTIAFFAIVAWAGWRVMVVLGGQPLISLPQVPARVAQSVIPIGAVLYILAELVSLPAALREGPKGPEAAFAPDVGTTDP